MSHAIAVPRFVFQPDVEAALRLIAQTERPDLADQMAQFLASLAHPDYVCSLANLSLFDDQARALALRLFDLCLNVGLSSDEKGALVAWLSQFSDQRLGLPPGH